MNSLPELIAPLDANTFVSYILNKESFLIKGDPGKLNDFFNLKKFYAAVYNGEKINPPGFRLGRFIPSEPGSLIKTMTSEAISINDIGSTVEQGLTICVTHLEACDKQILGLAESVKKELHYLGEVQVNCYLSPDGSGADMHFDARLGMILQIEGNKKWKYTKKAAVEWPRANAQINNNGEPVWASGIAGTESWEKLEKINSEELTDAELQPGDLLCLPAGAWHAAKANGYSLALNIAFRPLDYVSVITNMANDHFYQDPKWRGGLLPFCDGNEEQGKTKAISDWDEHLQSMISYLTKIKKDKKFIRQLYDTI